MVKKTCTCTYLFYTHKPLSLVRVRSTRVSTDDASRWTVRHRSRQIASVRQVVSGGEATAQLQDEMAILSDDERKEIMKPVTTVMTPEDTLAMKAGALLPWNKIRIMHG